MTRSPMSNFTIPDMECDGCISSITRAVKRLDAQASVAADLDARHIAVCSAADRNQIAQAIEAAGFTVKTA